MKVRYLGSEATACDLYRASLPFRALKDDHDVAYLNQDLEYSFDIDTGEIVGVNFDADVVILPRPITQIHYNLALGCRAQGIAVVVEVDDELDEVHELNASYHGFKTGIDWFYRCMQIADLITVTTQRLADKWHPEKSFVVRNALPDNIFEHPLTEAKWGIGWTGNLDVHPEDVQELGDSIKKMRERHGVPFRHIGKGNLAPIIRTNFVQYEWLPYGEYLLGVESFQMGVVPLAQSNFNNSKSALKGMEMAALGVPFVASDVAEYRRVNKEYGLGYIASSPYEFFTHLRRLTDDAFREEEAIRHREIAQEFSMSNNSWRWEEAWTQAMNNRKLSMRSARRQMSLEA